MKSDRLEKPLVKWRGYYTNCLFVGIMLFALLGQSCKSTSQTAKVETIDSLSWNKRVSVTLATIPSSLAQLTVPMGSLCKLPSGASYTAQSGQAALKLVYDKGNILASASCDSLQEVVYNLEEELHRTYFGQEERQKKEEPVICTIWTKLKWYLSGVLTVIILTIIIQTIQKYGKKSG